MTWVIKFRDGYLHCDYDNGYVYHDHDIYKKYLAKFRSKISAQEYIDKTYPNPRLVYYEVVNININEMLRNG
jgi:hypothetical protein